ncbi:MAG TPA: PIN domain-containing protein [Vicinamibacterales bacterium]|nr:PIN domain-containing protein [Vicinamibacterales bacterium]
MNAVFADTSALVALLNATDDNHVRAERAFATLRSRKAPVVSTSYVLVETYALIGRRLGVDAARSFRADFAPLIDVVWVDETLHNAGLDLLLDRRKRLLSLVDAVSFVTMRQARVSEAFAFDPHFEQEGFSIVS